MSDVNAPAHCWLAFFGTFFTDLGSEPLFLY